MCFDCCYSVFVMVLLLYQLIEWLQLVIGGLEELSTTQSIKLTRAQIACENHVHFGHMSI